jgi:imidazolonepropionase-like amidohydrolase
MLGEKSIGRIEGGCKADVLILNSNPLEDISVFERHEQELMAVIKEGRVCRSKISEITGLLDALIDL